MRWSGVVWGQMDNLSGNTLAKSNVTVGCEAQSEAYK